MEPKRKIFSSAWILIAVFTVLFVGILALGYLLYEHHAPVRERAWFAVTLISLLFLAAGSVVGFFWRHQRACFYRRLYEEERWQNSLAKRIDRLTRLYEALSLSGQAIMRSRSRDRLFEDICRIAVEKGGFSFAWVGLVDAPSRLVLPAGFHGADSGYLDGLVVSVEDLPEGRGPTGTAIRERRYVICPDIDQDAIMRPWRERAISRGYRSSGAFPLIVREECIGALMVYAPVAGFFDPEITSLLDELSKDLSHALESMERDQALERGRERLELALKSSAMGAWEWDVLENRNLWDDTMHELLGLEPGAPPGTVEDFISLIHPSDRERVRREMLAELREGTDIESRFLVLLPDARTRFVTMRGKVYRDARGNPVRMAGVCWDITDRRLEALKLQQQKELLRTMMDAIPVVICYFDSDGSFKWANKGWEQVLGWPFTGQDVGEILEKCYPEPVPRRLVQLFIDAAEGTWKDYKTLARNGKLLDIAWAAVRLTDGTTIAIGQDITEWKRVEEEIRRLNADLEERVRDRTSRLEEANRELEAFSYSVSHDLRTPLRAIKGYARILLDERSSQLDEEGRRLLGIVIENTEKMGRLIDDLLSFSRVGKYELTSVRIDMTGMVQEVIREINAGEKGAGLEFRVERLPRATGDASMIRQVWLNLVGNAVKFTLPKGTGHILVDSFSAGGDDVYYVKDSGVGFAGEYSDRVFGIFQRLHSGSDFEGTGVGLAIVERIVTRHGGRVWAEGKPGEGATFYFSLPRNAGDT